MSTWKTIALIASFTTLGTVGVHSFFNGFSLELILVVALASFLGGSLIGYITTLGKRK